MADTHGAKGTGQEQVSMRNINWIVNHCSAHTPEQARKYTVEKLYDLHVNQFEWADIGYHYLIDWPGNILPGRPVDQPGAHVKGYNHNSIAICYFGGVKNERGGFISRGQIKSLILLNRTLKIMFPHAKLRGHRDFSPDLDGDGIIEQHEWMKECPQFDVARFAQKYLGDL